MSSMWMPTTMLFIVELSRVERASTALITTTDNAAGKSSVKMLNCKRYRYRHRHRHSTEQHQSSSNGLLQQHVLYTDTAKH